MITMIKHKFDWELISQQKKMQINKYNIRKNIKRVDHEYKVIEKVMLTKNAAYKYEITYNGRFVMNKCWTNGMVTLQCGPIRIMHIIRHIKPYKPDTNVENINTENIYDDVNI